MSDDYEKNNMPIFPTEPAPSEPRTDNAVTEAPSSDISSTPVQPSDAAPSQDPIPQEIPVQPDYSEPVQQEVPSQAPFTAPEAPYQPQGAAQAQYAPPADTQPASDSGTTYPNTQQPYQQQYSQYQPYGNSTYGGAGSAYNRNASPYSPSYGATPQYPYQQQFQQRPPQPPEKSNKGLKVFLSLLAVVVVLAIVFTCVAFLGKRSNDASDTGANKSTAVTDAAGNSPIIETQSSPSSSSDLPTGNKVLTPVQIAAKVKPSVVGIVVYANTSGSVSGEGSGIIWKEDDTGYTYIITCAHVISGSGLSFTVQTEDGTQYDAERVGFDTKTDLGILKVKATGFKLAEFGDSSALQVGDAVYAVGNPGGTEFFGSFTSGVVSAIDRSVKNTYTMVCIQHDAAINPGNSGGALVNNYGQVVGINSLKIINTEYEGMGFAIPIKSAQNIINALAQNGYVPNRPKLGITYAEAIDYQQYSMIVKIKGLPSGSLIITKIDEGSSLSGTNAKQYDMIIAVDGKELTTADVLLDKIEDGKVGDELTLTICRIDNNYKTTQFDIKVKLVEDKGNSVEETTTTSAYYFDPYDFFGIN